MSFAQAAPVHRAADLLLGDATAFFERMLDDDRAMAPATVLEVRLPPVVAIRGTHVAASPATAAPTAGRQGLLGGQDGSGTRSTGRHTGRAAGHACTAGG